jgi:hypothetical protein
MIRAASAVNYAGCGPVDMHAVANTQKQDAFWLVRPPKTKTKRHACARLYYRVKTAQLINHTDIAACATPPSV